MRNLILAGGLILIVVPRIHADATSAPVEKGNVRFQPGHQKNVPERYRLDSQAFDYEMQLKKDLPNSKVLVYDVRFPSPVKSKHPENNTVHAEYYLPKGDGPFPCVIVLDITGGDQTLSRTIAAVLAQNRIAGLFVQMAYYGPRRPANGNVKFLSANFPQTMEAVRQTVLDLRLATAWMESRKELDGKRLGILGTSLGSFVAALAAEMEPKLGRVAVLLGGGGLVDVYYDDPRAKSVREIWELFGGTKAKVQKMIAPADPLTCAENLKDRRLLMIAARRDEIVPPKAAIALWEASGKQKIVWYDCTHYGAALYFPSALKHVVQHFNAVD